ncbi:MAG TPA: zf-HC2 domain-containing protein [Candidatus Dormibacteraeota bacterium]|nr:zf-HC2 domain-containing protein [Candidatus Dormibacteraeota bacterium]
MKKCQPRLLTPYHDGELTRAARDEIEEHLQSCPSCGAMLDEVVVASHKVRAMGRAAVPLDALVPAVEVFADRAGLDLGAPLLSDTVEVAREPAAVVAPVPPAPPTMAATFGPGLAAEPEATTEALAAEPEAADEAEADAAEVEDKPVAAADEEPEIAEAEDESDAAEPEETDREEAEPEADETEGAATEHQPPWERMPPPGAPAISRPTTAAAPGIGLADDDDPMDLAPMPPAPTTDTEATEHHGAEDAEDVAEPEEPLTAADAESVHHAEPEQMELAGPAEPVDFHAQAPPHELRPPWLGDSDVEEHSLEAEGRAAVDDAIEHETAAETGTEGEKPEESPESDAEAVAPEAEADEDVERDLTPIDPIPDPGPVSPRPEPRLEPPPEPWSTVWRPSKGIEPEPPSVEPGPSPEPAHDFKPAPGFEARGSSGVAGSETPLPEVDEAIARLRGDLRDGTAGSGLLHPTAEPAETFESLSDYRATLAEPREKRRPVILGIDLGKPANQVKVGAAAAAVLILVLAGTALALNRQSTRGSTATQTHPATQASSAPQTQASVAPATGGSPAAAPANKVPQLSGAVTSGAGGTGYTATKIRTGSPGSGITRLVLDLTGAGPTPSAQLGRGPDGAVYVVASGISVDPSVLGAFKGSGAVTGISQLDGTGLNLKLGLNGSPQYAMIYLSSPTRLVIDFK